MNCRSWLDFIKILLRLRLNSSRGIWWAANDVTVPTWSTNPVNLKPIYVREELIWIRRRSSYHDCSYQCWIKFNAFEFFSIQSMELSIFDIREATYGSWNLISPRKSHKVHWKTNTTRVESKVPRKKNLQPELFNSWLMALLSQLRTSFKWGFNRDAEAARPLLIIIFTSRYLFTIFAHPSMTALRVKRDLSRSGKRHSKLDKEWTHTPRPTVRLVSQSDNSRVVV